MVFIGKFSFGPFSCVLRDDCSRNGSRWCYDVVVMKAGSKRMFVCVQL